MRPPTPRSLRAGSGRGIGTLIGNGWLREAPKGPQVGKWDIRSKSALRKCMFLPVPDEMRALAERMPVSAAALPPPPRKPEVRAEDVEPHRNDPRRNARELPVYPVKQHPLAQRQQIASPLAGPMAGMPYAKPERAAEVKSPPQWWEDPIALGSLLILLPPVGLAAVWMSKRYSSDARWALTVMTALTMCLMSAIVIAALVIK